MTTLITGGASQTGLALTRLLQAAGRKVVFASRSGRIPVEFSPKVPVVKLDWTDPSTFSALWAAPEVRDVEYVYLLPPGAVDDMPETDAKVEGVKRFVDAGVEFKGDKGGVKRWVMLGAAADVTERGPRAVGSGKVHTYLWERVGEWGCVVLRPTWFTDNLERFYGEAIRERGELQTVVPTGRVPLIAVADIARLAFDAIVDVERLENREPVVIGPEYLTYDEVAQILSDVLGRKITHKVITPAEHAARYAAWGLTEAHARDLAHIESVYVEAGDAEKYATDPRTVRGRMTVREWVERNKEAFVM